MRKTAAFLLLVIALLLVPSNIGEAGPVCPPGCCPENPNLFCNYKCSSNSCVQGLYTDGWWCELLFPRCHHGTSGTYADCCRWRGEF